jgi:DNA-binding PadR family transcriptional regulator
VKRRRLRDWTAIGFSSIYHALNKLGRGGRLQDRVTDVAGGPAQRVYRATPDGRALLRSELTRILSVPGRDPREVEVALMFAHFLPVPALRACLAERARLAEMNLRAEQRQWRRARLGPYRFWSSLIFDHSTRHLAAERVWSVRALAAVDEKQSND